MSTRRCFAVWWGLVPRERLGLATAPVASTSPSSGQLCAPGGKTLSGRPPAALCERAGENGLGRAVGTAARAAAGFGPDRVVARRTGHPAGPVGGALNRDLEAFVGEWGYDMCDMEDERGFGSQIQHALAGRSSQVSPESYRRDALTADYVKLLHNLVA